LRRRSACGWTNHVLEIYANRKTGGAKQKQISR
jgi:hypothetical protein